MKVILSLKLDIRGRPGYYAANKSAIPGLLQDKIGDPWSYTDHEIAILCLMPKIREYIRSFTGYKRTILWSPNIKKVSRALYRYPCPRNEFNRTILDLKSDINRAYFAFRQLSTFIPDKRGLPGLSTGYKREPWALYGIYKRAILGLTGFKEGILVPIPDIRDPV